MRYDAKATANRNPHASRMRKRHGPSITVGVSGVSGNVRGGGWMRGRKPDEKLKREPRNIRNRLRRQHEKADADLEMLYEAGYKRPEDWDLEELARGRPRNKKGDFGGRPPSWITPHVQAEIRRRFKDKAFQEMGLVLGPAIELLHRLITDPLEDPKLRLEAAKFVINHVLGNPKTRV